ncbi:MAG: radical SAM protein [bacterium]|nr:radical SAM protein [bacterium]
MKPPNKILLVVPPVKPGGERFLTSTTNTPHMGLACLAAVLRQGGFTVEVLDAQVQNLSGREFGRAVLKAGPDIAGITAFTEQVEEAGAAAGIIKRINPDIHVIVGGCHPTALPELTLKEFPDFDFAVSGEGEVNFPEMARAFREAGPLRGIPGVAGREEGGIWVNPPRPFIPDLDALPFPAFELFPLKKYPASYGLSKKHREIPIQASRGCPYSCNFCFKLMGSKIRRRSLESVLSELRLRIEKFGARQVSWIDENLTSDREWAWRLGEALVREGINRKTRFSAQTRVDLVDPEILRQLKRAGFFLITYGAESGAAKVLEQSEKKILPEQIEAAVRWAREAGLQVQLDFIIGHPGETESEIEKSLKTVLAWDPDYLVWARLVPYPGTRVAEEMKARAGKEGFSGVPWSSYQKQIKSAFGNLILTPDILERWQIRGYVRFYLRPGKILNLFRIVRLRVLFLSVWFQFKKYVLKC